MQLATYTPRTRLPTERQMLHGIQFSKYLSRKRNVPAHALQAAMRILCEGILEALAEGYDVHLLGVGTFGVRVMPPRKRYHRKDHIVYESPESTIVHFSKVESLNEKVRVRSAAVMASKMKNRTVRLLESK